MKNHVAQNDAVIIKAAWGADIQGRTLTDPKHSERILMVQIDPTDTADALCVPKAGIDAKAARFVQNRRRSKS
jgi:hypothetical protein